MTEINFTGYAQKTGVRKMNKATLKIDMTPMVDLGFLLISFFILATELSKPAITKLYSPHAGDPTKIADSKSLTILLHSNDNVFYYFGNTEEAIHGKKIFQTTYNEMTGLGNIIRRKQIELAKRGVDKKELVVLIKPGAESSYKNLVNTLDEMLINDVTRYTIADTRHDEEFFLKGLKN